MKVATSNGTTRAELEIEHSPASEVAQVTSQRGGLAPWKTYSTPDVRSQIVHACLLVLALKKLSEPLCHLAPIAMSCIDLRKIWDGVKVTQVEPSNCFRRLEKLVLPSVFDTSLSSLMM